MNKKVAELFYNYISQQKAVLGYCLSLCESPIEEIFMTAFFVRAETSDNFPNQQFQMLFNSPQIHLVIDTQKNIGKYRVDFLIAIMQGNTYIAQYIIECDGHEFHEKTQRQVVMRNRRDRFFEGLGYTVIHLSGSEIYHDPEQALCDVLNTIFSKEALRLGFTKTIHPFKKEGV